RSDHPRTRSSARRGDRRDPGDRRRDPHLREHLRPDRHAGEQDRRGVPGRGLRTGAVVAALPRRDPDGDRVDHEPPRAGDRPAIRSAEGVALMAAVTPSVSLKPSGGLRRRQIVNRIMELIGWLAALAAVAVLFVVIISVAVRAWPALSWDFLTKPP